MHRPPNAAGLPPRTVSPGTRLGAYEIIAPIGAGGMGEVYRARDARLGRDVAVKVLPALLANDPDALARFEREMKTLAALSHPHSCPATCRATAALCSSRLDSTDGRRTMIREVAVDDPAGMLMVPDLYLSADARSYIYGFSRVLSTLYLVTGLR